MTSPLTISSAGIASWTHEPGDTYIVTGTTTSGKRFRFTTDRWPIASAINVYRGTYWLCRSGKRYKIQSRYN